MSQNDFIKKPAGCLTAMIFLIIYFLCIYLYDFDIVYPAYLGITLVSSLFIGILVYVFSILFGFDKLSDDMQTKIGIHVYFIIALIFSLKYYSETKMPTLIVGVILIMSLSFLTISEIILNNKNKKEEKIRFVEEEKLKKKWEERERVVEEEKQKEKREEKIRLVKQEKLKKKWEERKRVVEEEKLKEKREEKIRLVEEEKQKEKIEILKPMELKISWLTENGQEHLADFDNFIDDNGIFIKLQWYALFDYFQMNRYPNIPPNFSEIRRLIYNFKDGNREASILFAKLFLNHISLNVSGNILLLNSNVMVCIIPASNSIVNNNRFKYFCEIVSVGLKVINGFEAIYPEGERVPRHLGGEAGDMSHIKIDETLIKGKNILLFDDLLTTGRSFRRLSKKLYQAGATNVTGFFIGRTWDQYRKGDPNWVNIKLRTYK